MSYTEDCSYSSRLDDEVVNEPMEQQEEEEEESAYGFAKPAWATKGGHKLRSTGKADTMRRDGNLAAPITFTPFKNDDHTNYFASPTRLKKTMLGDKMKAEGNLANPITNIRDVKKSRRVQP